MRTRGAMLVCALCVLTGCPKDPDEVNPRRDDVPSVDTADTGAGSDVSDAGGAGDVSVDARDAGGDEDVTVADVTGDAADAAMDAASDAMDASADVPSDAVDASADVARDATDGGGTVTPSITYTFVSGVVTGSSGATSINAHFVWHGSIRGDNDAGTRIEAFFR